MKKKDEIKKTKSAQELNADSMENVSGGGYVEITQNGCFKAYDEYWKFIGTFDTESEAKMAAEGLSTDSDYYDDWY